MGPSIISIRHGLSMINSENNPIWHIAGIGSLGGLLASHFFHAGHFVKLIVKNEHQLADYQRSSLSVSSDGNVLTCHAPAVDLEHIPNEPIGHLICCVKAYDVTKLLIRLRHLLNEQSIIILIHNGLGVVEEIKTQLPQLRIISGVSTVGAYLEKPFSVKAFLDGKFHLGHVAGQFTASEIKTIATAFNDAELPFQWEENIQINMWEKFALNCSVNILTALFNCKNGDLLSHNTLLEKMTAEIAQVINTCSMTLSAANLLMKVTQLLNKVANNYSSMYNDVKNNRSTELHYLNEYLIKLALQKQILTPTNSDILNQFYAKFPRKN